MFPDYSDMFEYYSDAYHDEEPEQEEKKPTTIEDVEVSILEYYESAQKQIETLYAQYLITKALSLPKGVNMIFGNMFGNTFGGTTLSDIEDVVYRGHEAYSAIFSAPAVARILPRSLHLKVIRKYMDLLRSASIMTE